MTEEEKNKEAALTELRTRIHCCPHTRPDAIRQRLVEILYTIEQEHERKYAYTSGMRCEACNRKAGGVSDSEHLTGEAVDVAITYSRDRLEYVAELLLLEVNRIGVGANFIHIGISEDHPQNCMWLYGQQPGT